MKTTTGTFTLGLSIDPMQEPIEFEVEVEAEITEAQPERGPTYSCGGEPAVEGHAEIIFITYCRPIKKCVGNGFRGYAFVPALWLLNIIPQDTLDAWAAKLYEDYTPADDRADWERDQRRDQEATKHFFAELTGKAAG